MDFLKSTGLGYRYTFFTLAPGRIMWKTSRGYTEGQHGAGRTLIVGGVYGALTADQACLSEATAYARSAMAELVDGRTPSAATASACSSISTATSMETTIAAVARTPGTESYVCDPGKGTCE